MDFDFSNVLTQSGFLSYNRNTATGTTVGSVTSSSQVFGSITVKVNHIFGQTLTQVDRDRGAGNPANNGAFTYSDLLRDLFTNVYETTSGSTLFFSGLTPNTQYQIRLFSYDGGSNANSVFSWYDTTATTGAGGTLNGSGPGTLLGTFNNQNGVGTYPDDNNDYSISATVMSNANGELSFGHTATLGAGALNGFVLSAIAIPEPATAGALVGAGALLLVATRRKRRA